MRAGRVDAAATARILSGAVDRASATRRGDCVRRQARQVKLADGRSAAVRHAAARDRRRAGSPRYPRCRSAARSSAPLARRHAGPLSPTRETARHAVVIGASFIGLEVGGRRCARAGWRSMWWRRSVSAGTRARARSRRLHPRPARRARRRLPSRGDGGDDWTSRSVQLKGGRTLPAELVVVGIGVRPSDGARRARRVEVDRGVTVNEYLETSVPGIFAAGDIARWPDHRTGDAHPGSSTGWSPSVRARPPRGTSWARASGFPMCRSSGASTTTSRSTTWATPSMGRGRDRWRPNGAGLSGPLSRP